MEDTFWQQIGQKYWKTAQKNNFIFVKLFDPTHTLI